VGRDVLFVWLEWLEGGLSSGVTRGEREERREMTLERRR